MLLLGAAMAYARGVTIAAPPPGLVRRFRDDLAQLTGRADGRLGIAVSGGPDSLALLLLARTDRPGDVEAATVDHRLRSESAAEAEMVARLCRTLDVPHAILVPRAPICGSLQAEARRVRYELLEPWRRERRLDWIVTAHHADDQAETLLMRLNRGAGVGGLSGVRAVNGKVLRPLLGWRRSELEQIVAAAGIEPVADPSNADERFDRARLRRRLTEADWIDPAALARSAQALAEANEALDWEADRLIETRAAFEHGGSLDPDDLPAELRRRLVLRMIRHFAPHATPRGDELGRLLSRLEEGATATLCGVKCRGGRIWTFETAPPRRATTA